MQCGGQLGVAQQTSEAEWREEGAAISGGSESVGWGERRDVGTGQHASGIVA